MASRWTGGQKVLYRTVDTGCGDLLPPSVADANWRALMARLDARIAEQPLTERQAEVARLIVRGMSRGQIAERLGIRSETLKTYYHEIYERLGIPSMPGQDGTIMLIRVLLSERVN